MKAKTWVYALAMTASFPAFADNDNGGGACDIPGKVVAQLQSKLAPTVAMNNGGIFAPNRMWSAIVDRKDRLCSVIVIGDAWPGSRSIAIAKATTANGFSNDALALSTANLYSAVQPGGSLFGLNNSNPFNPEFQPQGSGINKVPGGVITFGGGVPLYMGGKVIGGLGLSGDSACADHVIAYRMRRAAGLDAIPAGVGFGGTDNIDYLAPAEPPNGFKHPHCFPQDIPPGSI
ncbi:MAG TPA: heme-binding protein [Burkholderiales bacterium]|nr:heme-binding protein [Burkholderiales bacterium]